MKNLENCLFLYVLIDIDDWMLSIDSKFSDLLRDFLQKM